MNTIDNGVEKVLNIKKIIRKDEMYFEVVFIDWYGHKKIKKFSSIKNLKNERWVE